MVDWVSFRHCTIYHHQFLQHMYKVKSSLGPEQIKNTTTNIITAILAPKLQCMTCINFEKRIHLEILCSVHPWKDSLAWELEKFFFLCKIGKSHPFWTSREFRQQKGYDLPPFQSTNELFRASSWKIWQVRSKQSDNLSINYQKLVLMLENRYGTSKNWWTLYIFLG